MTASYRTVHYAQRPAKNIERKMMVDTLGRLHRLLDLDQSRYIGLGSVFFTDFVLMHRALGLTRLVSIEDATTEGLRQRFEANRPFDCVDLRFGHTNQILPKLFSGVDADFHTITWLDYDSPLDSTMLTDVATVAHDPTDFSVLAVSVQVEPGRDDRTRLEELRERVGKSTVPRSVHTGADLAGDKTAQVARTILSRQVERTLQVRNASRPVARRVRSLQVFNFQYADDARMLTVGWIFARQASWTQVQSLQLEQLDYTRDGEAAFRIRVPRLTTRETLALDRQLPVDPGAFEVPAGVAPKDAHDYLSLYRFYPTFVDATL